MKILYTRYTTKTEIEFENLIKANLTGDPYAAEGTIERLELQVTNLINRIAKLIELMLVTNVIELKEVHQLLDMTGNEKLEKIT